MSAEYLTIEPTWDAFRAEARRLLRVGAAPEGVVWVEAGEASTEQLGLLTGEREPKQHDTNAPVGQVPRAFVELGEATACHRQPSAWPWLYRVLWRISHGERNLLRDPADGDMVVLNAMERAVRRDSHKMKAFVRFRTVLDPEGERFVAWFEPKHRIVRRTAPFFERRFPSMRWSILTPDECVHWDTNELSFTAGLTRASAPDADALEEAWLTYYAHTFNPARVRVQAMRAEMPVYYWRNMPEATAIPELLRDAPGRVRAMIERGSRATAGSSSELPAREGDADRRRGGADAGEGAARRLVPWPLDDRTAASPTTLAGLHPGAHRDPPLPLDRIDQLTASSPGESRPRLVPGANEPPPGLAPIRVPRVRIGIAGWDYPDWAGRVYPSAREGVDRLRWVAARFDLIEVNSTFYRAASRRAATSWLQRTQDRPELQFAAKLVRSFTHERGAWREADVAAVKDGMSPLADAGKLTSLLIQFPWSFKMGYDERRHLKRILDAFADFPMHVEVRHTSWNHSPFFDYLSGRGVGIVNIDQPIFDHSIEPAEEVTSSLAYLRLHGRNSDAWFRKDATRDERYDYSYPKEELLPWVERTRRLVRVPGVEEVEVVFNNHYRGQAVDNATEFGRLLREREADQAA